MSNNNLNISVSANLDKAKSIVQINKDIKNIEKQLAKLKLKATIDKSELQKQIKALNKQKRELYVSLKIRKNELKAQYKKAVQEAQAQPLNVNVNTANAQRQMTGLTNSIQATRGETVTLASALKKSFSNMGLVVSAQTALQLVRKAATEAKQAIMEYDKYATNLKIITNKDDVSDMVADYADKSIKMGVDVSEYLDAAENILRAGKSVEESNEFIEKSLMLAKTGFIDAESAANNLLVISNSYDVSAEKLENLTDTLLTLDSITQTTAGSLSEAMAKSAKNAQLAGLSYEKLAAMIAQLKNSTGKSEAELSTSINQILNRTYRVKPNAYIFENENGETEDMTKPLSDVEKIMNQLNISIRKSKTEFKGFEDIISTIAPIWKDLSSVDKNSIASVFGGQHKNVFLNLVNDWSEIESLTSKAENSLGATQQKYNSYLESIESKTAKLSTTTKEMFNNLIPQSFASDMVDTTTAIVRFTDKYNVLQTGIKSAVFYGLAKGIIATKNSFSGMVSSVRNVSYAMELASKGSSLTSEQFRNLQMVAGTLTDKQLKLILSTDKLTYADKLNIVQTANMTRAEAEQKLATMGITQAQNTATISTFSLSGAFKLLFNIIRLNPVMALTIAFTAVTSAISKYKQEQEELIESAKQSAQETKEYIDSLEGLKDKYLEIVDSENSMSEKTQELNKFKQELVETYGFEKDIIDKLNLSREHGIELLDEEAQKQAKAKRNEFYAQNDDIIQKSIDKIENVNKFQSSLTQEGLNRVSPEFRENLEVEFVRSGNNFKANFLKYQAEDVFAEYELVNENIAELQKKRDSKGLNSNEETFLKDLENYSKNLNGIITKYKETYNTYYEYKSQDLLEDYVAHYGDASNLTGKELESWKNNLYATADGNKVLEESLTNLADKYIQLSNAEKEASADDTSADTENISELDDNVSNLNDKLDEYKEKAKSFSSIQATIKKATEEQNTFGRISGDTINALHEAGLDGAMTFNELTGETYFLVDSVDELTRALIDNQNVEIEKSITDTTNDIKRLKEEIKNLGIIDSADEATKASELYKQLAEKETDLSDFNLQKRINTSYRFSFETTSTDNYVKDAFNKEKSDLDYSFNMDMITQEEYYNQLGQLNEKYYKDKEEFLDEYRQYEVEVYKGLKQIQGNTSKEAFEKEKNNLDYYLDMNKISQEEYYKALSQLNEKYFKDKSEFLDEYRKYEVDIYKGLKQIQKESFDTEKDNLEYFLDMELISQEEYYNRLNQLNEQYFKGKSEFLDEYRQYEVEVYKGLKQIQEEQTNSIKEAFDKEKSELDHLNSMNAIKQEDYYNKLFELNEKYFKDKTELLDEYRQYEEEVYKGLKEIQIKALQEQIDALKSVNEEKQEEIDLEKAKQALENAKRNKTVKVYDSERGWIRETDRNAIDSAQKEYDDLVLNEKVETLENLIESIENGTNTSHNLDESVNAVEQVNSLGQRVIPGNVDLTLQFKDTNPYLYNRMREIQGSVIANTDVPSMLANQFDRSISSDSYTTNNKTMNVNIDKVIADDPVRFTQQMEQIADERFKENFPPAMNQFGRDLKRYQMNHSN